MITVNYAGYKVSDNNYTRVNRPGGSGDYLFVRFETPMHVCLADEIAVAEPGACILYRPGEVQEYSAVRDYCASYVFFSAPDEEIDLLDLPAGELFMPNDGNYVDGMLRSVENEYYTHAPFFEVQMDALMHQLLVYLSRESQIMKLPPETERPLYRLFCQARYTMLSNCEQEWASTNMCQMVSMGRSQFYKYYNMFFGVSPMSDLNDARIEKAKNLLTNRELTVTEIATRCGYASIHHFSRTFKDHCGLSPLAYVKSVTGRE